MPHVVICGELDLARYARDFEPLLLRTGPDVLRADRIYLERNARSALIEALVVEARRKLPFYVVISTHDRGSITLRVDPMTHIEHSDGVRRLVAELAADILARVPGGRVRSSNVVIPSPGFKRLEAEDEDRK